MKRFIICLAITAAILPSTPANGTSNPDQDKKYYSLRQYVVAVEARENLIAVLAVTPAEGWKWNKKYPASFSVLKPAAGSRPYRLVEKHIESIDGDPEIEVWMDLKPSIAAKVRRQRFIIQASYSLCNKTTCRVFKREIKF